MGTLLLMFAIVILAVVIVSTTRTKHDRKSLAAAASERGGRLLQARRVRSGHPFPSAGRGWWVWEVTWEQSGNQQTAWVLTTREGIKEWRD